MTRLPVILNPTAGGGRLLRHRRRLEEVAARTGAELDVILTRSAEEATGLTALAASDGVPLVLAFGGDGTYNAVARGLLGTDTAMGVLPGGTTSVLAFELGVPRPAARAVASLLRGEDRRMRVGRTDRGDIVLLMVSAGPDTHVLERLRPWLKRHGGRTGIALQGLFELVNGSPLPRLRVLVNGVSSEVGWAIVGKSRCYGGRHAATPGADPFRSDLEVVAQRSVGRCAALPFIAGIPAGRHVKRRDVMREIVDRVRLEPAAGSGPVSYQVDGDLAGTLPVEVTIDPRPLLIRLPATRLGGP